MQKGKEPIKHFTDLVAWQEGHGLVLKIYLITKDFPSDEKFGLISQMRRSASSVTANIAEGFGRQGYRDKIQFYIRSRGSDTELQDQLITARDLGFIDKKTYNELMEQAVVVNKLLNGLIKSIRNANP